MQLGFVRLYGLIGILLMVTEASITTTASSQRSDSRTMQAARFEPGGPEKLYINSGETIPEPKENEIRIQIYATALNRADTLQRRGLYPVTSGSDILGLEASGIIDKVGPNCPDNILKGQRVSALLEGGGNAEYATCRYTQVLQIPSQFSFVKAAAIPEVWLTAYQLLYQIAGLTSSDTVLIHAGASGVGTAAVQLVKQAGATAVVTAGSSEKIEFAKSFGAKAGVNYKEGNIAEKVLEATDGQGVDVILDCVGASMFEDNLKVIKTDGRWISYGLLGGAKVDLDLSKFLRKRLSFTSSTLRTRSAEYKASLVKNFAALSHSLFETGEFRPVIDRVLPFADIAKGHALMEENKNAGKIILKVREEEGRDEKDEL